MQNIGFEGSEPSLVSSSMQQVRQVMCEESQRDLWICRDVYLYVSAHLSSHGHTVCRFMGILCAGLWAYCVQV